MESKLSATAPEFVPNFALSKHVVPVKIAPVSRLCPDVPEFIPRSLANNADQGKQITRGRFANTKTYGQPGKNAYFSAVESEKTNAASTAKNVKDSVKTSSNSSNEIHVPTPSTLNSDCSGTSSKDSRQAGKNVHFVDVEAETTIAAVATKKVFEGGNNDSATSSAIRSPKSSSTISNGCKSTFNLQQPAKQKGALYSGARKITVKGIQPPNRVDHDPAVNASMPKDEKRSHELDAPFTPVSKPGTLASVGLRLPSQAGNSPARLATGQSAPGSPVASWSSVVKTKLPGSESKPLKTSSGGDHPREYAAPTLAQPGDSVRRSKGSEAAKSQVHAHRPPNSEVATSMHATPIPATPIPAKQVVHSASGSKTPTSHSAVKSIGLPDKNNGRPSAVPSTASVDVGKSRLTSVANVKTSVSVASTDAVVTPIRNSDVRLVENTRRSAEHLLRDSIEAASVSMVSSLSGPQAGDGYLERATSLSAKGACADGVLEAGWSVSESKQSRKQRHVAQPDKPLDAKTTQPLSGDKRPAKRLEKTNRNKIIISPLAVGSAVPKSNAPNGSKEFRRGLVKAKLKTPTSGLESSNEVKPKVKARTPVTLSDFSNVSSENKFRAMIQGSVDENLVAVRSSSKKFIRTTGGSASTWPSAHSPSSSAGSSVLKEALMATPAFMSYSAALKKTADVAQITQSSSSSPGKIKGFPVNDLTLQERITEKKRRKVEKRKMKRKLKKEEARNEAESLIATPAADVLEVSGASKDVASEKNKPSRDVVFDLGDVFDQLMSSLATPQSDSSVRGSSRKPKGKRTIVSTGVVSVSPGLAKKNTPDGRKLDRSRHGGLNFLDSTSPMVKRGKERETPRKKRPTMLKKIIKRERELRRAKLAGQQTDKTVISLPSESEANTSNPLPPDAEDVEGSHLRREEPASEASVEVEVVKEKLKAVDPLTKLPEDVCKKLHTRKFREYCDHVLDKDINKTVFDLLTTLQRFQDRVYHESPFKAKIRRRLVLGLREVKKHLVVKKLKCVIIAPNLERVSSQGGIDDYLAQILSLCQESGVMKVFSMNRHTLGKLLNKHAPVSIVGIFNYDGAQDIYKVLVEQVRDAQQKYQDRVKALMDETFAAGAPGSPLKPHHTAADAKRSPESESLRLPMSSTPVKTDSLLLKRRILRTLTGKGASPVIEAGDSSGWETDGD